MISISQTSEDQEQTPQAAYCMVGIGGAGGNVLDRLALDGVEAGKLLAANTDLQALSGSVAGRKVQLGATLTRGLGTGGDPDLGYQAAEASLEEFGKELGQNDMVFLCAGLGGGTGSGALPLLASKAKESGAFVILVATLPFSFEGRRRREQAETSLAASLPWCDVCICFENDRMSETTEPGAGIHETFQAADHVLSRAIRSLGELGQGGGLIPCSLADLRSAVGHSRHCLFGFGESESDNRAAEALAMALKSPLLDRGRLLRDAESILVHAAGGRDLTLFEVERCLRDLERQVGDQTQILLSIGMEEELSGRMHLLILGALERDESTQVSKSASAKARPRRERPEPPPGEDAIDAKDGGAVSQPPEPEAPAPEETSSARMDDEEEEEEEELPQSAGPDVEEDPEPEEKSKQVDSPESEVEDQRAGEVEAPEEVEEDVEEPSLFTDPEPAVAEPRIQQEEILPPEESAPEEIQPEEPPPPKKSKSPTATQEVLQFEPVSRGRFEKSEPTIVDGEDLDVPTFLRKNAKLR